MAQSSHGLSKTLLIYFPLSVPQLFPPFTPFTWEKTSMKVSMVKVSMLMGEAACLGLGLWVPKVILKGCLFIC